MKGSLSLLFLGLTILLVFGQACLARSAGEPPNSLDRQGEPTSTPELQSEVPGTAEGVVKVALADLATVKGIAPERLKVTRIEDVNWPDTSLGCPEPGIFYAQVITPGYKIFLSDGEKEYEYHSDRARRVIQCQKTP